ncbi:hypothetical protein D3C73_1598440 [compost metagenome]
MGIDRIITDGDAVVMNRRPLQTGRQPGIILRERVFSHDPPGFTNINLRGKMVAVLEFIRRITPG